MQDCNTEPVATVFKAALCDMFHLAQAISNARKKKREEHNLLSNLYIH